MSLTPIPKLETQFAEITALITSPQKKAYQAVNTCLLDLYWQIGEYISHKLKATEWGEGVVEQLAKHINQVHPNLQGFTRRNLFRMRQFYEIYRNDEKVSPLVRQLKVSALKSVNFICVWLFLKNGASASLSGNSG